MTEPGPLLLSARRILAQAARDLEHGFYESACVSSQRGAVLATEAWLRGLGQTHVSGSVHENVSLSPGAGPDVREAALRLDRHRLEEGYPHRSAAPASDPVADAFDVVAAGRQVLRFVEERMGGT